MTIKLMDTGGVAILDSYLNKANPVGGNNLVLKLFTSAITPTDADVIGNYVEAVGAGYTSKTLTAGSWAVAVTAGIPEGVYAPQTFTFTGPLTTNLTVYGYFIVDGDGTLIYAEASAAPFTPALNGDTIIVIPKIQLSHGTPA